MMNIVKPSQLDMTNPSSWPIYYKITIWIFIAVIIFLLGNQIFLGENREIENSNESKISQMQTEYKSLYHYSINLPVYQNRSLELIGKLELLLKVLPKQAETPALIDSVHQAAQDNSINLQSFTPSQNIQKLPYYDLLPVELTAATQYQNLGQFAQTVASLERLMNISDFSIERSGGSNSRSNTADTDGLSVTATLQTYIYNQDLSDLKQQISPSGQEKGQK